MIQKLYNQLHRKFYYSTSFHNLIAPKAGNQKIASPRFSFYGKKLLSNLLQMEGVRIIDEKPGVLILQLGKIKAEITTLEELYILNEIFIDGCYNFLTPDAGTVVVDIGLNVGMASLFFAQSEAISRVYSFEPFEPTFKQALKNISLNDESIKNKIIPSNYGIAGVTREEEWDYVYSGKGNMGLRNSFEESQPTSAETKNKIRVTLKGIAEVLPDIISRHPSQKIVLKIDCEGAEYEILEKLAASNLLKQVHSLLIEWHVKGPGPLTSLLQKNGFSMMSQFPHNKVTGMIYGFRTANS